MPNPVAALIDKHFSAQTWLRLKREVIGLAVDFWADGTGLPLMPANANIMKAAPKPKAPTALRKLLERNRINVAAEPPRWGASNADIADIMYGPGFVLPGGAVLFDRMIAPLALGTGMRVLDLSAGLGGGLRSLGARGIKFDAMESDPILASRIGAYEIKLFDPSDFTSPAVYDAIILRDLFFRIAAKQSLFQMLAEALLPQGRLAFTDYVLNPEHHGITAIKAWRRSYQNAEPWSLMELAEGWAKAGFKLAEAEDLTDDHRRDLKDGLKKLARHIAGEAAPDKATKQALLHQLQLASQTLAALDQGLKFYRFLGVRA